MSNSLHAQLANQLLTTHHLPVSPAYLTTFQTTIRNPPPPFPALLSTLNFRILASDITQSLSTTSILPPNISDVNTKSRTLTTPIVVQVLDIWDIGSSKWAQIEAIERVERGEEIRGREVIRTVPIMNEEDGSETGDNRVVNGNATSSATTGGVNAKRSQGPHKLLLQDAKGTKVMAFELSKVPKTGIGEEGICIGSKLLLKQGLVVRRGMPMLRPEHVQVLGGKVEAWDAKWKQNRKKTLLQEVQHGSGQNGLDGQHPND